DRLRAPRVEHGDETRPQRRDGAGPADGDGLAVDAHQIPGLAVGVAADVGHATADLASGVRALGDPGRLLVVGQLEELADAAAGGPAVAVVPDRLAGDAAVVAAHQPRAAAGQDVGAGGREVRVGALDRGVVGVGR